MKKKFFIYLITLNIFLLMLTANAQTSTKYSCGCDLVLSQQIQKSYISPPFSFLEGKKTSEFELTFVNTTAEVEKAVRYAADIWSSILVSDVPIRVIVKYYPIPDLAGQCISNLTKDFPNAPLNNTWYVSALADAISGVDQKPDEYDMDIIFNNTLPWYFGLDGNGGANTGDFVSVALHEMGHGLGYFGLGNVKDGIGSYGLFTKEDIRPISFPFLEQEGLPSIYDKHIVNNHNMFYTDTTFYSNSSSELRDIFVSDSLFFQGENAIIGNNKNPVKIESGSPFIFGSSLLHLDENSYPANSENALMTTLISGGEANHNHGPLTIGLLMDLGWKINDSLSVGIKDEPAIIPETCVLYQNYPNPFNPTTNIKFTIPSKNKNSFFTKLVIYNVLGEKMYTLFNGYKSAGSYEVEFDAKDLTSGVYFYNLIVDGKLIATQKMILTK